MVGGYRRTLIDEGRLLADIGHCGTDDLQCAVCDDCVEQLEGQALLRALTFTLDLGDYDVDAVAHELHP